MSIVGRMTRLLEATKKPRDAARRGAQLHVARKPSRRSDDSEEEYKATCVRCGVRMSNDRDYEETDDGVICSTCGTREGRWY